MSGAPTLVTLGVDRTQSPTALAVVNAGVVFATLGTFTVAGVWTPANALVPGNNLSDIGSPVAALANLGAASASSVTALAGRSLSRGRVLALAIAN